MNLRGLAALAASFLLILVTACSSTPIREDKAFIDSLTRIILPEGWNKNPPEVKDAVFAAEFSAKPGSTKWRSALVLLEINATAPLARSLSAAEPGKVVAGLPPMKSVQHLDDYCVDIEFEDDPKQTRVTARAYFMCAANTRALILMESGYARIGDVPRAEFVRRIRTRVEE